MCPLYCHRRLRMSIPMPTMLHFDTSKRNVVAEEDFGSPAIKAAVEQERRFLTLEGNVKEILNLSKSLDDRVKIQNGRVSTVESNFTKFVHDHDSAILKQASKQEGTTQTWSFIDKMLNRAIAVGGGILGIYIALQQSGLI